MFAHPSFTSEECTEIDFALRASQAGLLIPELRPTLRAPLSAMAKLASIVQPSCAFALPVPSQQPLFEAESFAAEPQVVEQDVAAEALPQGKEPAEAPYALAADTPPAQPPKAPPEAAPQKPRATKPRHRTSESPATASLREAEAGPWARFIRDLQAAMGWTEGANARLAKLLDVAPSTISNWLGGHRTPRGLAKERLFELARQHEVAVPAGIEGVDEGPRNGAVAFAAGKG